MQGDELLEAGFAFETVEFAVARPFQEAKLRAAGIDAGRCGDRADSTFLGHGALKAMRESGISAPAAADGFETVAEHRLTPEGVAAYSDDALNAIHSDPEVAARFGFPRAGTAEGRQLATQAAGRRRKNKCRQETFLATR